MAKLAKRKREKILLEKRTHRNKVAAMAFLGKLKKTASVVSHEEKIETKEKSLCVPFDYTELQAMEEATEQSRKEAAEHQDALEAQFLIDYEALK